MKSNGIAAALEKLAAMHEAGIEIERLNPIQKALQNPKSLRLAVNAKCYDCNGQDDDPGWRQRIGTCHIHDCSLNPVRPYQLSRKNNYFKKNTVETHKNP